MMMVLIVSLHGRKVTVPTDCFIQLDDIVPFVFGPDSKDREQEAARTLRVHFVPGN
jgi:hypothetical protein